MGFNYFQCSWNWLIRWCCLHLMTLVNYNRRAVSIYWSGLIEYFQRRRGGGHVLIIALRQPFEWFSSQYSDMNAELFFSCPFKRRHFQCWCSCWVLKRSHSKQQISDACCNAAGFYWNEIKTIRCSHPVIVLATVFHIPETIWRYEIRQNNVKSYKQIKNQVRPRKQQKFSYTPGYTGKAYTRQGEVGLPGTESRHIRASLPIVYSRVHYSLNQFINTVSELVMQRLYFLMFLLAERRGTSALLLTQSCLR